jgi:chemotaxis protein MotB
MTTLAPMSHLRIGPPAHPQKRLWLITFVDLVMLLLAFFVLMFSMSRLDENRYAALARSYADVFHGIGGRESTVGPVHISPVVRVPGDDLAYLEAVLRTAFAHDPDLTPIQFRLTAQYLILSVPARGTAPGSEELDEATQRRFFALGGVLNNLPNRVAVVAPAIAAEGAAAWSTAAQRARHAQASLQAAGYERDVIAFAQGSAEEIASDGDLPPLDVIVFPESTVHPAEGAAP